MSKIPFKELVKKLIRKGDTAVDNDLSSDEEKWLDDFDAEMQEAKPVNLAILTRKQLIYYVIKLRNKEEREKIVEDYKITDEELKELRKYVTSSGKLYPGIISGLENYNINSSSSSSVSSCGSYWGRLIKKSTPTHSNRTSSSTLSTASQTLTSRSPIGKKKGKSNKAKQIKSPNSPKLQAAEQAALKMKFLAEARQLQAEQRRFIEEWDYLEDDVFSLGNSSQRTSISKDSSSSKDKCIYYDEDSSRIIKRIRTSSRQRGKTDGMTDGMTDDKTTTKKSSNQKGKKIKTGNKRARPVPKKSSVKTSKPKTKKKLKTASRKRKDRHVTPKYDEYSEFLPSEHEKTVSTATSSEGGSNTTKNKSLKEKPSNVKRVTFQSPVSDNSSQVSSEMEELEKRFVQETIKCPFFPDGRVLRSASSRSTKSSNNEKMRNTSSSKPKVQKLKSIQSSSSFELSCSDKSSSSKPVHSEKICQESSEKSSIVSISSSCSCSCSQSSSCSCSKNSSVEKGASLLSVNSETTPGDGKCVGESVKVGSVDNIVNVCSPKSLADGASGILKDDMPSSNNEITSPKSNNINSSKSTLSDVELSPVISSLQLRVAGKGLSDSTNEAKVREPCYETFPDTSGSSSENLYKPFLIFSKDNPYIWNKYSKMSREDKLMPFLRYLPKYGEAVSFHLLLGGYNISSTPLLYTDNNQRVTTRTSDTEQDTNVGNEPDVMLKKGNQKKKRKREETKPDKGIKPKISKRTSKETKPCFSMTLRSDRTKLKPRMSSDVEYATSVENESPQLSDCKLIQFSYEKEEDGVELYKPNQEKTGYETKLNEGMILRSGKIKPPVSEVEQLIKLFKNLLLIKQMDGISMYEELIKSPEVRYVTLSSGERKKFKSSNISKIVRRICNKQHGYKTKEVANKSKKKKLTRQEKLMNKNANIINIRNTQTTTLYNFGRDCIQMVRRSVAQPPRAPILCGMNCGKPKAYMCTTTGVYVCSLQCYRKNLESYKKAVQDFVDENATQIIESESEQFPTVEDPSD